MRSALFVDFDNVYTGLSRLGPSYAEAFARQPTRWLDWLVQTLARPPGAEGSSQRRILVRRCYLNPEPYKRFRIGFSRAGFEIVDCPPMTAAGKTSTDIHMVLDIIDVLQSATRYDEFIVFSADADFTPVLRKLRREDRRTTVFAAGATSASYDASADLIIDAEAFLREALGVQDGEPDLAASSLDSVMAQAEAVVWRVMDRAEQPVPLPALTKALAVQVPELPLSDWAGKGTFLALLKSLSIEPLRIDRELNALVDPRRLKRPAAPPAGPVRDDEATLRARVSPLLDAIGLPPLGPGLYRAQIEGLVRGLAQPPYSLGAVSQAMLEHCQRLNLPLSRDACLRLLRTLVFHGFQPEAGPYGFDDLVALTCGVVLSACAREGVKVDDGDRLALLNWMSAEA